MIRIALLMFCFLAATQQAIANSDGIDGRTGTVSTCGACHSALGTALLPSTGNLIFPANVSGSTFIAGKAYTLNFVNAGAPAAAGSGFNMGDSVSVSQFSADAGGTTSVQSGGAEIAHATPDNFSWLFDWETDELTSAGEFQWCTLRVNGNDTTSADGPGDCDTKSFTVIANQPPNAIAGSDQTVSEGSLVSLDGSASNDEFPDLAYQWTQLSGPTVTFSNANSATPTFTAPNVEIAGASVMLSLTVTEVDHDDLNDSDTIVINLTNINQPPIANAGPDQSVAESATATLDGSATTDPDLDDSLTYAWLQTGGPTVSLSSAVSVTPTFQSPAVSLGGEVLTFQLTVTDLATTSSTDSVIINVLNDNEPPIAAAGADQVSDEGNLVQLSGAGSTDESPASLLYSWVQTGGPTITLIDSATVAPSFTAPEVGFDGATAVTVQLTVTDAFGLATSDSVVINTNNVNLSPTADAGSAQTVGEDVLVTLNGSGSSDPDLAVDDIITYAWTQTGGITVTLSAADTVTPTFQSPFVGAGGGTSTFSLTVTDRGALQSTDTIVVSFTDGNVSPIADAGADQTVNEGATVTVDGSASTDDLPTTVEYAWAQVSGPTVSITGATNAIASFTAPEVGFDGLSAAVLSLTVTDAEALTSVDTVEINFTNVNLAPTASAGPDQTVGENVQVSLSAAASTDPDLAVDDVLTYAWTQTGGIAVSLTAESSASPSFLSPPVSAAGGSATFMLTVTDRGSLQSSDSVVVNFTDGNTPPIANAGSTQTVDEGTAVALNGSGSSDNIPATLQFAWVQVSGPTVSLTGASTATPSFTAPEVGFDGLSTLGFSLTVTDEETLTSSDTVSVNISNVNRPPTADASNAQTLGEDVLVTLNGSGSTDPDLVVDDVLTYAWTQTGGIAVSLTAADTATPTFQSPNVSAGGGSSSFSLSVTDRGGLASTDSVVISFTDGNTAPVASAGPDQTVSEGMSVSLTGLGTTDDVPGTLQYAWSRQSGPAVSITGATTATPSFTAPEVGFDGASSITFLLTVTDEESLTGSDTVTVNISNVNQPPSADAGSDQTVGEEVEVTLSGAASTDPDLAVDDELIFAWQQTDGIAVTLASANTETPTFQSPSVGASGGTSTFLLTVTDRGALQSSDSVVITFSDGNLSPVANAGANQTVNEGTAVTLDGSASTDEVVSTLEFAWTQTGGPSVALAGATTAAPSFTAPEVGFDSAGAIVLSLVVTDEESLTSSATVEVTVTNVNQPPAANAGPDQTVEQDTTVTLNGGQSTDPDTAVDDFLTFAWAQTSGPAVALSGATTATPTFTSPIVSAASQALSFELTVTDRGSVTDTDTVLVALIDQPNQAPIANAGSDVEVPEQMAVTLDASNSGDVDGSIVSYLWTQVEGPAVNLPQADEAVTSFTAPEVPATGIALRFQLLVTDDDGQTATAFVSINVRDSAGVLAPVAAVLPSSRSVSVSGEAGAFATVLNPSDIPLTACGITPVTSVQAGFTFFATDPLTNAITGNADPLIDIPAKGAQTYALFFDPTAAFNPTDVEFAFQCSNAPATQAIPGVNSLLLSATTTGTADIIALVATVSNDGTARIPGPAGVQAFSAATANVGAAADITASVVTSLPDLNISLSICETNPATGACLAPPATETTSTVRTDGTSTYSVFVSATGEVPFDPANNRIRVVFVENGVVRGSTSVAVTTDQ